MARAAPSRPAEKIGRRWQRALVIALLLGLAGVLLAGVVLRLRVRTVEGEAFVVFEIDQPGAEVFVDGDKFNVTVPGDNKPLEIRVEPGQHKLRISKDGFVAYTRDIELTTGKFGPFRVRLEALPRSEPKAAPATAAADALRRADIPEAVLATLGGGDPKRAPAELIALLGEGRFRLSGVSNRPAFSPDGALLAVPSGGEIFLFDAHSGQLLRRLHSFGWIAFSPDGAVLAVVADGMVSLWDPRRGVLLHNLSGHGRGWMSDVVFAPDSKTVLSCSADKTVRVWDVATGRQLQVFSRNVEARSLAITPDGRLAFAGTYDSRVHGWSPDTGAKTAVLEVAGADRGTCVSVSADGRWLAAGTNAEVKVWKIADLANQDPSPFFVKRTVAGWTQFEKHSNKLWTAEFSNDTTDKRLSCWDPAAGQLVASITQRSSGGPWMGYALSPDDRTLAAFGCVWDRLVHLYDTRTGKPRFPDPGHTGQVLWLDFSPDGRWLASAGQDKTARVWDLTTGAERHRLEGHAGAVNFVAFGPDSKLLASASQDGTIRLWDPLTGAHVRTLNGYTRNTRVRFSPDGALVAAGTDDGVRMWFARSGEEARRLQGLHQGLVRRLAFRADGQLLATGGMDGKVVITDLTSGQVVQSFQHGIAVCAVEFTADGETVAVGYEAPESVVRLWSLKNKDFVSLTGHTGHVRGLALRSDGRLAVTSGAYDSSVRLWEIGGSAPRKMVLWRGGADNPLPYAALSPEGRYVASGNADGTIYLFRLPALTEDLGAWLAAHGSPPPGLAHAAWLERVARLPLADLPDTVADRLRELNPGFDGKIDFTRQGQEVVGMKFAAGQVKDISPVQALSKLQSLSCSGMAGSDLMPLRGLPLTSLEVDSTKVADLRPLQGMPLKYLNIWGTPVINLAPLKGMSLDMLRCGWTPVADLAPLRGVRINTIYLHNTQVTAAGLAPLQEVAGLKHVCLGGGNMSGEGLMYLKKLPELEVLEILDTPLSEPAFRHIKEMTRLRVLRLRSTALPDAALVHLRSVPSLRVLSFESTPVGNVGLDHLASLKNLDELNLGAMPISEQGLAKLRAALPKCKINR
jgi:WD40 repeat protein